MYIRYMYRWLDVPTLDIKGSIASTTSTNQQTSNNLPLFANYAKHQIWSKACQDQQIAPATAISFGD